MTDWDPSGMDEFSPDTTWNPEPTAGEDEDRIDEDRCSAAPYYTDDTVTLYHGHALDVLRALPDASVDCCVTSPPYFGLRDYGVDGQIGLEASPAEYVETLRAVFAEVWRVLADDGVLWLNLGDSYANPSPGGAQGGRAARSSRTFTAAASGGCTALPAKNLMGVPWRVAFALQDDGWTLRNAVIWNKPNAMPESVTDRLSTRYEHVFLFSKSRRYWFDLDAIREAHVTADPPIPVRDYSQRPGQWAEGSGGNHRSSGPEGVGRNAVGRNPGDVWSIPTSPFPGAHFATMPPELARRCILAGCKPFCIDCDHLGAHRVGTVLDPFHGSGTTGMVATKLGRRYIGIDLNADYLDLSLRTRLAQGALIDEDRCS